MEEMPDLDLAALDTEIEMAWSNEVEEYIRNLTWSDGTSDEMKMLVAGNIRGFANRERINGSLNGFISKLAQKLGELGKVANAAKEFVHYHENWEGYEDMKTSNSTSIPVEFMNLGEAVEDYYGKPSFDEE